MPEAAGPEAAAPEAPAPEVLQRAAPRPRIVVAFDYGRRRIGVACGDTVSRNASPLPAVPADKDGPRWERVGAVLRDWQPNLAVVGLPYNVDGTDSGQTVAARGFAAEIAKRYGLEVVLVDERYSSLEAQERLKSARASGLKRRRIAKADVDAAAACVILERWFGESASEAIGEVK
jgi:putative Holliday junction resolvase